MSTKSLFDAYQLGAIALKNRIVMAPLTRSRAGEGDAPRELNAEYYGQRAGAGLIISEASQVSKMGQGYLFTPGSYSAEQTAGWKKVVETVHSKGGKMFQQLWHVGRISHVTLQPEGKAPISSTEEAAKDTLSFAKDEEGKPGYLPASKPRMATVEELQQVIADYRKAAENAREAGFDGVEVHGANGYLFDQFLNSAVNQRSDEYGNQTKESRTKLLLEAYDAAAGVMGPERTGVRIAPFGSFGGMLPDPKAEETFLQLAQELAKRKAVYVHIVRGSQYDAQPVVSDEFLGRFKKAFGGTLLVTGGLTKEKAEALLHQGLLDLAGFGSLYISNPDLVERFKNGWPLTESDQSTWYGGGAKGYTDYPTYSAQ